MQIKIEAAARQLREAAKTRTPCPPVRNLIGEADIETAYAVQAINNAERLKEGAIMAGCKIGATSVAIQEQFGVASPDFGVLWADREIPTGGEISIQTIMQPKIEGEIAFVLGKDLISESINSTDVISAIDYAVVAIELLGSRIAGWDIHLTDTIADNASASHWIVGRKQVPLKRFDLLTCKMVMERNGEIVSAGIGSDCLGSPLNAALWLARTMIHLGNPMRAGYVVLTGALGQVADAGAGDHFRVSIDGLGETSVRFTW